MVAILKHLPALPPPDSIFSVIIVPTFNMVHFISSFTHPEQPNPEILGKLMSLILKHNVFEFDEKFYLQMQGTAMGTKMAPTLCESIYG